MSFTVKTPEGFFSSHLIESGLADLRFVIDQHLPPVLMDRREAWLRLADDVLGAFNEIDRAVNRASIVARVLELSRQIEELQKGLAP